MLRADGAAGGARGAHVPAGALAAEVHRADGAAGRARDPHAHRHMRACIEGVYNELKKIVEELEAAATVAVASAAAAAGAGPAAAEDAVVDGMALMTLAK